MLTYKQPGGPACSGLIDVCAGSFKLRAFGGFMITKGSGLFSQHSPRAAAEYVSFYFFFQVLIISIYQLPTSAS